LRVAIDGTRVFLKPDGTFGVQKIAVIKCDAIIGFSKLSQFYHRLEMFCSGLGYWFLFIVSNNVTKIQN
jgi:hypothetical protein